MTFKQLQDRVMDRLKLSSTDARDRVKNHINERYRAVATSCGMIAVRFGTVTLNTVNGTKTYSPATLIHPITIAYPGGNRVLTEISQDQMRQLDPDENMTGEPFHYVVQKYNVDTVTLRIWPTPNAAYALTIDGILTGTDLSADGDKPALPEDFHDVLLFGALGDELMKLEKINLAESFERKFQTRLGELRYFIAKTAYLPQRQGDNALWWWGFWFGTYHG